MPDHYLRTSWVDMEETIPQLAESLEFYWPSSALKTRVNQRGAILEGETRKGVPLKVALSWMGSSIGVTVWTGVRRISPYGIKDDLLLRTNIRKDRRVPFADKVKILYKMVGKALTLGFDANKGQGLLPLRSQELDRGKLVRIAAPFK